MRPLFNTFNSLERGRVPCLLLLIACLVGCHKHRALETNLQRLDERMTLLELRRSETESQLREITQIKQELQDALTASERRHAELRAEILALRKQVTAMGAKADALQLRLDQAAARAKATPPKEPEKRKVRSKPKPARKSPPKKATDRSRSVTRAYCAAMQLLQEDKQDAAENALRTIAKDHSNHVLAPNAHYWLGEIAYDRRKYAEAIASFEQVLKRYPQSAKAPDALLKIGKALERQGKLEEARQKYKDVQAKYPKSRAATLAADWLR